MLGKQREEELKRGPTWLAYPRSLALRLRFCVRLYVGVLDPRGLFESAVDRPAHHWISLGPGEG